jgi:hypothetical protein
MTPSRPFSSRAHVAALLVLVGLAGALAGCATTDDSTGAGPALPTGEVLGQGTVLDDGDGIELCLGPIMESYPPQCGGIPVIGWDWATVDGSETEGDVTWGAYAVTGTYDGVSFTVTQPPIMLALYDPMPLPDPTGGVAGSTSDEELLQIQDEVSDPSDPNLLGSYPMDGYLFVETVWDDGHYQSLYDEQYGEGVVIVTTQLHAVSG